jgi:hypothetical protein
MADPFAPPAERASVPPPRRDPFAEPGTRSASGQVYPPMTGTAPPASPPPGPRPEPASPGVFWTVAALGVGLILLGRLILFFVTMDDMPDDYVAPSLFTTFGVIALSGGLALAGVFQRGLNITWRIALLLGAGYFAVSGDGLSLFTAFGSVF